MALLQQNPSSPDDAALGEELTKGTSHVVIASVVAAILVSLAIAAYFVLGEKPPAATGQVTSAVAHIMHRETSGLDAAGSPMPKSEFDQVLLFTHIKLHNQSKNPLFLRMLMANVTLPDGIHTSYAAIPADYERVFQAYPELASLHGKPLKTDETVQPGQTVEGDFVCPFQISKADWEARKEVNYTVSFRYQPNFTVQAGTITEK